MKTLFQTALMGFAILGLSACASTPDPAEICSAEWIAPRASSAVAKIEKRASSSLKTFSTVSKKWAVGDTPNALQMWKFSNAISKLNKELRKGQGIKDLKKVATTCSDPKIISDAMRGLMERQGVSDTLMTRIENNPIYQSAISIITEPDPVDPNG